MKSRIVKSGWFLFGTLINNSLLFTPIRRLSRKYYKRVATAEKDICIEGFQRSGNSFLYRLFQFLNPEVKIAHHIHGSQNIFLAAKYNLPTIVLIRKPDQAIASLLVWNHNLSITVGLFAYRLFYSRTMRVNSKVRGLMFEDIIADPQTVIQAINNSFPDTDLKPYNLTPEEFKNFKKDILSSWDSDKSKSPLPNDYKEARKAKLIEMIKVHPDYDRTFKVYEQFISNIQFITVSRYR